ncbi:hypothetical protein IKH83_03865 [Candidatus Saccharibacteria bacterium]|nr:hypothetical protein [Candidatus Saccharibacteria bacterium]
MKSSKLRIIFGFTIVALALAVTFIVGTNYYAIHDTIRSWSFNPTPAVENVRKELNLTDAGDLIFKATNPTLDESQAFNSSCQSFDQAVTILGCYTDGNIHVYDVKSDELDGIVEATVAHEMLHAVWARLSEDERSSLTEDLKTVFKNNYGRLSVVNDYADDVKFDELFARAGTEIRDIPENLEKVYSRYFTNRSAIVSKYERFRAVFDELADEIETLSSEIENLRTKIDADVKSYKERVASFNAAAAEFNDCANTTNCFTSEYTFTKRRSEIIAEQEELNEFYERIMKEVEECNEKIRQYNNNVLKTNQYNEVINSNIERVEQ